MPRSSSFLSSLLLTLVLCLSPLARLHAQTSDPGEVRTPPLRTLMIVLPSGADEREKRYADLAARHLRERGVDLQVTVQLSDTPVVVTSVKAGTIVVYCGRPAVFPALASALAEQGWSVPTEEKPGPEGFLAAIKTTDSSRADGGGAIAYLAAVEPRAVLFSLGWLLRQTRIDDHGLTLPITPEPVLTAPRTRLRGTNSHERQAMDPRGARETGARSWSAREGWTYIEEQWLLGANQLYHGWGSSVPVEPDKYEDETGRGVGVERSRIADQYDIDYVVHQSINGIGRSNMKPGWQALDQGGRHDANVCVSVPEARAFLLQIKERFFKWASRVDRVILASSDVAGCECDACAPWSRTFWDLSAEMARDIHKYHPRAQVSLTNQDFQIKDNAWFFSKIRAEDPAWLGGYCMAPGGSETNPYGGIVPNPEWQRHPGLFPGQTFLKSRLRYLSPRHEVLTLSDISHWKRAEYGIDGIDPLLSEVYHRRTYNARPVACREIITSNMAYADGVLGYSEGNYDDFNKFAILRLTWEPTLGAARLTREYFAYHCGEAAADLLTEAALQGERNYALPVLENASGILRAHELVSRARPLIPAALLARDWRFSMLAQRAATDLYILKRQIRLRQAYDAALAQLPETQAQADKLSAIAAPLHAALEETAEEKTLREEALALDAATDKNAAVRSTALLVIKDHDGIGVRWLLSQIGQIRQAPDPEERRRRLAAIVNYDRVGPREFYENCGTASGQPHFDFASGELYYGTSSLPADSRPSQRSYNYSTSHQEGLRFRFAGLAAQTDYELTFIHPNPTGVSFAMNSPNEYEVHVNGEKISRHLPSGGGLDRITVPIPARLVGDGRALELQFKRVEGRARSTCISEVWLRKAP